MSSTVGFTGTRSLTEEHGRIVVQRLELLVQGGMSRAVTGACHGVDALIAWYLLVRYPRVQQTIVVPADRRHVDESLLEVGEQDADWIYMSVGTQYRDRNEKIVALSDVVEAFWTGQTARSGTYMTINIAKRAGKLRHITKLLNR